MKVFRPDCFLKWTSYSGVLNSVSKYQWKAKMTEDEQSSWVRVEGSMPPPPPQIHRRKPRVLLADDESHIRTLMRVLMTTMNCKVVGEAKDGQEAAFLYRKLKPDLLLLDINMPMKTGEEALMEIMTEFPDAFVIMLTSVTHMESVKHCLDMGAANYIRKDTQLSDMKKIIKETWTALNA